MQDRVPTYPGRVKLTPVSGQENTYDMVRADNPTQNGDPINKNTLLKDTTAALFGLGKDAVPDDVFAAAKTLIDSVNANADTKAKIAIGSYTGTGKYGSGNKNRLTFDFVPLFVVVTQQTTYGPTTILLVNGQTRTSHLTATSSHYELTVSWNDNVVNWYADSYDGAASSQLNGNGNTYYYVAIG